MKPQKSSPFNVSECKHDTNIRNLLNRIGDIPINKYHTYGKDNTMWSLGPSWNQAKNQRSQSPDFHNAKQGGYMDRIKFKDFENVTQKGYAMIQINGTYVGGDKDGEPFSTRFFKSAKHLFGPTKDAAAGDILAVTFKQNGKFRNAIKIENETANGTAQPEGTGNTGSVVQPTNIGGSVQIQPPTDTKYLDAKIATKFYLDARLAKIKPEDISEAFIESLQLADLVQDWRDAKGAFSPGMSEGIPGEEDLEDLPE